MNNKDGRRKLLKSLAAGSGAVVAGKAMPESWGKPIINSVVLPAHASTTDDVDSAASGAIQTTAQASTTQASTTAQNTTTTTTTTTSTTPQATTTDSCNSASAGGDTNSIAC